MNKIYNNLTVENLIRTEWFNQFEEYQQFEIKDGLKENLDVSWYAKKEFNWKQMSQIRLGLKANLDVSKYANPELKWGEMESFRLNLLEKEALKIIFSSELYEIK